MSRVLLLMLGRRDSRLAADRAKTGGRVYLSAARGAKPFGGRLSRLGPLDLDAAGWTKVCFFGQNGLALGAAQAHDDTRLR